MKVNSAVKQLEAAEITKLKKRNTISSILERLSEVILSF